MKYSFKTITILSTISLIVIGVGLYVALGLSNNALLPNQEAKDNDTGNTNQPNTQIGIPVHLSIPKIKVEADIEPAGLDKNGAVAVPSGPSGVTWYKLGAKPGEMGSAILTGHYGPWLNGATSVFDNLNTLEPGDVVYVKDNLGNTFTFRVNAKKTYKLNETVPEIFNKDDASYLNLITCIGQWLANQKTFTNRLVIFTELVKQ